MATHITTMKTIDLAELEQWQREETSFVLLDVLPNHTLCDVAHDLRRREFVEQIYSFGIGKAQPVVLYEAGSAQIELNDAAEALADSGFCEVFHFVGPQAAMHTGQHSSQN